jgi:hypothetical protein
MSHPNQGYFRRGKNVKHTHTRSTTSVVKTTAASLGHFPAETLARHQSGHAIVPRG